MTDSEEVLCAGIVVADHVCTPISHLPGAGELVMADRLILTIGGCAANAAVDLVKMGVRAAVVGRVGGDALGRVVADMLREHGVDVSSLNVSSQADTSQTLIVNVVGEDRRFIHTFGANAEFRAADIPPERVARCRVLYVGGYLLMPELRGEELAPVFAAARKARKRYWTSACLARRIISLDWSRCCPTLMCSHRTKTRRSRSLVRAIR
jgi:sugar/nucleoside kinase (ribokinase family)